MTVVPDVAVDPGFQAHCEAPDFALELVMKADIHPNYDVATVRCSCGNTFTTRSTSSELHSELCNECHPFYTGKQKLVDSGGRIDRFERRYGKRKGKAADAEAKA
jgi:large subunit ribosomal protein L31